MCQKSVSVIQVADWAHMYVLLAGRRPLECRIDSAEQLPGLTSRAGIGKLYLGIAPELIPIELQDP